MIYIDSCVPMYIVGAEHPLKERTLELLSGILASEEELITSAEAFQEILHRYTAINSSKHLNAAYEVLEELCDSVLEVKKEDCDQARLYIARYPNLSSRDCLHSAIMHRAKCAKIWTYDKLFDEVTRLQRIY
jgi:uncharacterized protein